MASMNPEQFELHVYRRLRNRLKDVGDMVIDQIKMVIDGAVENPKRRPSKLGDALRYEIKDEGNTLVIVSDSPIIKYLDKGTKPYKIRPKHGKALKFKAREVVLRKDGSKIGFGENIFASEVNHPGIEAREFMSVAIFQAQNKMKDILFKQ